MLILTRREGESIIAADDHENSGHRSAITDTVLEVQGRQVKVGIEAPAHVKILREELVPGI